MPRNNLRVRAAEAGDVDALTALLAEHRDTVGSWAYRVARTGSDADTRGHYLRLLADGSRRLVVAVDGGTDTVIGMAVFGVDVVSTLTDLPSVSVSHLLVAPAHRHRGAGRALLSAAAGYADEVGIEHVVVGVSSGGRDANRFLARLGFAPLVLRRIAPVSTLRRTLGVPGLGVPGLGLPGLVNSRTAVRSAAGRAAFRRPRGARR
jgi:ribosomal protein S18 acetylase RimI-like enzyme